MRCGPDPDFANPLKMLRHLESLDAWLGCQQLDRTRLSADALDQMQQIFERIKKATAEHDPALTIRGPRRNGEHRYAIAIDDGSRLWLTLWVRRKSNGECFVMYPRGQGPWQPHASYHRDGRYHQKSYNVALGRQLRQPIATFKGTEHLGAFGGHGEGMAVCNPSAFNSVITVPPGVLDGRSGFVLVDLVEPGIAPLQWHRTEGGRQIVREETYRDVSPWVSIAVVKQS